MLSGMTNLVLALGIAAGICAVIAAIYAVTSQGLPTHGPGDPGDPGDPGSVSTARSLPTPRTDGSRARRTGMSVKADSFMCVRHGVGLCVIPAKMHAQNRG